MVFLNKLLKEPTHEMHLFQESIMIVIHKKKKAHKIHLFMSRTTLFPLFLIQIIIKNKKSTFLSATELFGSQETFLYESQYPLFPIYFYSVKQTIESFALGIGLHQQSFVGFCTQSIKTTLQRDVSCYLLQQYRQLM